MPDGKFSPLLDYDALRISDVRAFTKRLLRDISADDQSRMGWMTQEAFYIRRRFGLEFRDVDFPWPGASNIIIPTIDSQIELLKPDLVRSTLGVFPRISVLGRSAASIEQERNVELLMQHVSETEMVDFAQEIATGADSMLQHGHITFAVEYQYRTTRVRDVITKARLPIAIQAFVARNLTAQQADLAAAVTQQAGIPGVLTPEDLKEPEVRAQLEPLLQIHYGLDPEDEDDAQAIKDIFKFLQTPSAKSVTITKRRVVENAPRLTALRPQDLIVHRRVRHIQEARRVTRRIRLSLEEIRELSRDEKWSKTATKALLGRPRKPEFASDILSRSQDLANDRSLSRGFVSGDEPVDQDTREIHRVYTWAPERMLGLGSSDRPVRIVVTMDPVNGNILRAQELPYVHGKWPFVQIRAEYTGNVDFYGSRGIPQILDDLDCSITDTERMRQNMLMIGTAPVLLYRMGQHINPSNLQFLPGQMFPVQRPDDVVPLTIPLQDVPLERDMGVIRNVVQERTGQLVSQGQSARLTRPRTATEIQAVGSEEAAVQGSRILLWHEGMAEVYDMIFVRNQKVQGMFQTLIQALSLTGGDLGDKYEYSMGDMVAAMVEGVDPRMAKRFVRKRTDEEIQQIQQQRQAQQDAQLNPQVGLSGDLNGAVDRTSKAARAASRGQINSNVQVT
jgi:hypothetical protein